MEGIIFEIENSHDCHLKYLLEGVNLEKYKFLPDEYEFSDENNNSPNLLDTYFGTEIKEVLDKKLYIIFFKLQIFSLLGKIEPIETPDDFLNSDCELVMFITDCIYIEMYVKNEELFELIKNNVYKYKCENIKIINKCERKKFSVNY